MQGESPEVTLKADPEFHEEWTTEQWAQHALDLRRRIGDRNHEIAELRAMLKSFAEWNHKTLVPSKLHDPARVDIEDCPALTCKAYREVMSHA